MRGHNRTADSADGVRMRKRHFAKSIREVGRVRAAKGEYTGRVVYRVQCRGLEEGRGVCKKTREEDERVNII